MTKKIYVLIAIYSLISHSVESVAAEPEGVEPRRILTLKEQALTWHHYSDLPTVCGQKVGDFLNFCDKTNLQTIDQINSWIIENRYKDKDSPFLKIQSALLFFFDGIRANNSAAFKMYVSPKLSISDRFLCLHYLCMQGLVSEKIANEASNECHKSPGKSLLMYNEEEQNIVFEKTLGFLWEDWQHYLFCGDTNSYLKRNLNEVKHLAELGWTEAQRYVVRGLAEGTYGFTQDPTELKRLAELGWRNARNFVANGLAEDCYGFTQDPIELKRLAELGWERAQSNVARGLAEDCYGFTQDPIELKRLAELGWTEARKYVAGGLAKGMHGFTKNLTELRRLAYELNWTEAQRYVVRGLAEGTYGFTQDPTELKRLAELGWTCAQQYVVVGVFKGRYGFIKDRTELRHLAKLGWINSWTNVQSYTVSPPSMSITDRDLITYPTALKLLEQTPKWVYSRGFSNVILHTIPLQIDKLAFGLHMACLEQSRKG